MTVAAASAAVIPDELKASVQHLGMVNGSINAAETKLNRLKEVRAQTLEQIAFAVRRVAADRKWDRVDLLAVYEEINCPGLHTAWTAAGLPHLQLMRAEAATAVRCAPNDPVSGGWVGEWEWGAPGGPLLDAHPRNWMPVVYVLYGPDASPVYCGSTEHFKQRLKAHHREGKRFVAYRAVPCTDREQAYALEDRLLKQSCPPLNRKASR